MGGNQINLQPCRAGTLRGYRGNSIRINVQKTTINNINTDSIYVANRPKGLSTGEKLLLGLGTFAAIGGAALGAIAPKDSTDPNADLQKTYDDNQARLEEQQKEQERIDAENQKLREQAAARRQAAVADVAATRKASEALQRQQNPDFTAGAREVTDNTGTSPYKVRGTKNGDGTVTGDTGYTIIAAKYKSEDGKALTDSEIKALAREIFKGKGLKVGDIELPNEVTVNGKTYTYDKNAPDPELVTYQITNTPIDIYQGGARKNGSYWVATLNGKDLAGQYSTESEAKAAAEKAGREQTEQA